MKAYRTHAFEDVYRIKISDTKHGKNHMSINLYFLNEVALTWTSGSKIYASMDQ